VFKKTFTHFAFFGVTFFYFHFKNLFIFHLFLLFMSFFSSAAPYQILLTNIVSNPAGINKLWLLYSPIPSQQVNFPTNSKQWWAKLQLLRYQVT
jgi:hypothetical protein